MGPPLETTINSRLYFKQSLGHIEYIMYVYSLLSHYCITLPKLKEARLGGKTFYAIYFYTRRQKSRLISRGFRYLGLPSLKKKKRGRAS